MLQRDGRHVLLRCVTTVLTYITLKVHCVGRDQAVGGSLPCQGGSRKECPRRRNPSIWTWKTINHPRPCPVFTQHHPKNQRIKSKPSTHCPVFTCRACIPYTTRSSVNPSSLLSTTGVFGILGVRRIRGHQALRQTLVRAQSQHTR